MISTHFPEEPKIFINISPLIEGAPNVKIILFQIAVCRKKCYKVIPSLADRAACLLRYAPRRILVRLIIYHEKNRLKTKFKYHMGYVLFG